VSTESEAREIIEDSTRELIDKFGAIFSSGEIRDIVEDCYQSFANARVRTYVAVFTTRYAEERLNALSIVRGITKPEVPAVLFVCVHNAGRSQMAAGFLRHLAEGRVRVFSGGSNPGIDLNSVVVAAMKEVGVDISEEVPKPFATEIVQSADVVITMGCGDTCPIFPGKRYEDWELDDPAGQPIEVVRPIRDDIKKRVEDLYRSLVNS
jgi:protein-tyrosine-phosphatase